MKEKARGRAERSVEGAPGDGRLEKVPPGTAAPSPCRNDKHSAQRTQRPTGRHTHPRCNFEGRNTGTSGGTNGHSARVDRALNILDADLPQTEFIEINIVRSLSPKPLRCQASLVHLHIQQRYSFALHIPLFRSSRTGPPTCEISFERSRRERTGKVW